MTDIKYKVNGNWTNAALAIYKVGAIYMSVDSTSPATLFGGTWVALEGRMLIGADSTYAAGTTGGSKTTTLATANLPAHAHTVPQHGHGNNISYSVNSSGAITNGISGGNHNHTFTEIKSKASSKYLDYGSSAGDGSSNTGGTGAHSHNLPNHTHTLTKSGGVSDCAAFDTQNTGSGSAFDTISPYLAVYM